MIYSRSPFAERERQTAGQASPLKSSRDRPDDHFDQRARAASIHSIHSGRKADQPPSVRPPLGRRIVRGLARSVIAVLIGVGGTLAWQCYGDAVKQVAATRAPTLGWLLSYLPTKVPVITASANPAQQRSTSGLDAPRNSVEQLAARQAQMAQNIAALQAIVEDIRQKMSFTPASVPILLTQPPAPGSQQKSAARTQAPAVEAAPPPRRPLPAGPLSISR